MSYRLFSVSLLSAAVIVLSAGTVMAADAPAAKASAPAAKVSAPAAKASVPAAKASTAKPAEPATAASRPKRPAKPAAAPRIPADQLVDINSATAEELKKLPGIGAEESAKIIAGRPYGSKSWLHTKNVLSDEKYQTIRELVAAKDAARHMEKKK